MNFFTALKAVLHSWAIRLGWVEQKVYVRDAAGTVLYTTPSALAVNTWVRIELRCKIGAAGTGAIAVAICRFSFIASWPICFWKD